MKRSETGHMKAFTGRGNARDEETARLQKSDGRLHGRDSPAAAYPFMRRYQGRYPVTKIARLLGVSQSAYYARLVRKPGGHEQTDMALVRLIGRIREARRGTMAVHGYGGPCFRSFE
ncbi:MAG: hypothetical protein LBB61_01190 [Treponema sp.]|nr:hypothetical protein [Treponema sp.]